MALGRPSKHTKISPKIALDFRLPDSSIPTEKLSVRDQFFRELSKGTPQQQRDVLEGLSEEELYRLNNDWELLARPDQLPPADFFDKYDVWLIRAGRRWGKGKAGSNFFAQQVLEIPGVYAVYSRTNKDLRANILRSNSGIIAALQERGVKIDDNGIDKRDCIIEVPNGSIIYGFSGDVPDSVRGQELFGVWYDELAFYTYRDEVWHTSQLALSAGRAWSLITTTTSKRSNALLREIEEQPTTFITNDPRGSWSNLHNLAPRFANKIKAVVGTRREKEEIYGEIVDDGGALWNDESFKRTKIDLAELDRIVIGVDPASGTSEKAGETGIIVAGKKDDICYILADLSEKNSPEKVARKICEAYHYYKADRVVVERNFGGEWVTTVINQVDPSVPVSTVNASVGKRIRAEMPSQLYEQGKVFHCGNFQTLEDQMVEFDPDNAKRQKSPDRLDALVWCVHYLYGQRSAGKIASIPELTDMFYGF